MTNIKYQDLTNARDEILNNNVLSMTDKISLAGIDKMIEERLYEMREAEDEYYYNLPKFYDYYESKEYIDMLECEKAIEAEDEAFNKDKQLTEDIIGHRLLLEKEHQKYMDDIKHIAYNIMPHTLLDYTMFEMDVYFESRDLWLSDIIEDVLDAML